MLTIRNEQWLAFTETANQAYEDELVAALRAELPDATEAAVREHVRAVSERARTWRLKDLAYVKALALWTWRLGLDFAGSPAAPRVLRILQSSRPDYVKMELVRRRVQTGTP